MTFETFKKDVKLAGIPALAHFLSIAPNAVVKLIQNGNIDGELEIAYEKMSNDAFQDFQNRFLQKYSSKTDPSAFLNRLRLNGVGAIAKFLRVTTPEVELLLMHNELEDALSKRYQEMLDQERAEFLALLEKEAPVSRAKRPTSRSNADELKPVWSEIRSDHHEETDGFIVAHVDAWKTSDGDEEGEVIAKVIGTIGAENEIQYYVSHQDVRAMVDVAAIEEITGTIEDVKAALFELREEKTRITRTRMQDGNVTRLFVAIQHGINDAEVFAQVSITPQPSPANALEELIASGNGYEPKPNPFVQYYSKGPLSDDQTNAVLAAVADLKAEFGVTN